MTSETMNIRQLAPRIGAEIEARRETLLSGVLANRIRAMLEERGVLAFPQINLATRSRSPLHAPLANWSREAKVASTRSRWIRWRMCRPST